MTYKIIDLTQTIYPGIPDWDGGCGFQMKISKDYTDGARVQTLHMPNGIGTHIDAPNHFIDGGVDIANINIEHLICPGILIDVSKKADHNYALSVDDIVEFEEKYGFIPEKSIVIASTGWSNKWHDPIQYRNESNQGLMRFPKFSAKAAEFLLKRNINGIAIDTLSPDWPDSTFPVHHKLLGAGKYIIENLKIVNELPKTGFTIMALPIKIRTATEAPCRVIALLDK